MIVPTRRGPKARRILRKLIDFHIFVFLLQFFNKDYVENLTGFFELENDICCKIYLNMKCIFLFEEKPVRFNKYLTQVGYVVLKKTLFDY